MDANSITQVSVDDHAVEGSDTLKGRLPAAMQVDALRVVVDEDGTQRWESAGFRHPQIDFNAVAGRPPGKYGVEPLTYADMRRGTAAGRPGTFGSRGSS
jgi:hypothetical protein